MLVQRLAVVPLSAGPEGLTLSLDGELDAYSARDLVTELDTLRDRGHVHVRLDMAGLTFVDSTGLHTLVEQDEVFQRHGGRLVVERPAGSVRRVLQVAGLDGDLGRTSD